MVGGVPMEEELSLGRISPRWIALRLMLPDGLPSLWSRPSYADESWCRYIDIFYTIYTLLIGSDKLGEVVHHQKGYHDHEARLCLSSDENLTLNLQTETETWVN